MRFKGENTVGLLAMKKKTVFVYVLHKMSSTLFSCRVIQVVTEGNGNPPSPTTELSTAGPRGRPLAQTAEGMPTEISIPHWPF